MANEPISDTLIEKISSDPFARSLGIEVVHVAAGEAQVKMCVRDDMLNAMGTPHGGAIFTLADTALAVASNSHGVQAVALDVSITYCRPARVGSVLTAEATEENLSRSTGLYRILVRNEEGKHIALAHGTVFRRQG